MESRTQVLFQVARRSPLSHPRGGTKEAPSGAGGPTAALALLQTLYGAYYKCPCERGSTCNGDKTIVGSITNTNFGVCLDLGRDTE